MDGTTALLAPLTAAPERAALLDVDGTLAPIVDRPEDAAAGGDARAPPRPPAPLRLVACVSGRTEEDARHVVGVAELVYVGEHGMGLDPRADEWADELDRLVADSGWEPERKEYSAAFHYRTAEDEAAAVASLRKVEHRALELGLRARWGRKVLEILPPVSANKGTAVAHCWPSGASAVPTPATTRPTSKPSEEWTARARRPHRGRNSTQGRAELGQAADLVLGGTDALVALCGSLMHLTDEILAPIRDRYGEPMIRVEGEISAREFGIATYNPARTHDVTLFILNGQDPSRGRLRWPRCGTASRADPQTPISLTVAAAGGASKRRGFQQGSREAFEETGLRVELERYSSRPTRASSTTGESSTGAPTSFWRRQPTSTSSRTTRSRSQTRAGGRRARRPASGALLGTGFAFWQYRVALHDAAAALAGE